jgi:hypothetical protein
MGFMVAGAGGRGARRLEGGAVPAALGVGEGARRRDAGLKRTETGRRFIGPGAPPHREARPHREPAYRGRSWLPARVSAWTRLRGARWRQPRRGITRCAAAERCARTRSPCGRAGLRRRPAEGEPYLGRSRLRRSSTRRRGTQNRYVGVKPPGPRDGPRAGPESSRSPAHLRGGATPQFEAATGATARRRGRGAGVRASMVLSVLPCVDLLPGCLARADRAPGATRMANGRPLALFWGAAGPAGPVFGG